MSTQKIIRRGYKSYKHVQACLRRWFDPAVRQEQRLLAQELRKTRQQIAHFMSQGKECEQGRGAFVIFNETNLPFKFKFHLLLAKAAQLVGYTPIFIYRSGHRNILPYLELFGLEHTLQWEDYTDRHTDPSTVTCEADLIMPAVLSIESVHACRFQDIPVGLYALSRTCRSLKELPPDLNVPAVRHYFYTNLKLAIASAQAMKQLLAQYPVRKLLLRDIGYVPAGPVLDVALQHSIDCQVIADGQRRDAYIFKRYRSFTPSKEHEFSIAATTWEHLRELTWTAEMDTLVTEEFNGRYNAHADYDIRRLQLGKELLPISEVREQLRLDPSKKTAVIFAHVSWDGAFFFGEDLFSTFDEWLVETTRCAIENPYLNWIVKLHPLNVLHQHVSGEAQLMESEMHHLEQLGLLPDHVRILHSDTPINTQSLFPLIDYGLTVRGTIGLELPCLGIPVLTAGTGRYEGRGFTIDSATPTEYRERLKNLHHIPPLTAEQITLARQHYYYLMIGRQVSFADVAMLELGQQHEADEAGVNTLRIGVRSLAELQNAHSIRTWTAWLEDGQAPDFLEMS